jgi:hypothetical protein
MGLPIDFNYEVGLVAIEIDNERSDRGLPTELPAAPTIAELLPQDSFCWRERLAQLSGPRADGD